MRGSINGGTPIAGWFISWNIYLFFNGRLSMGAPMVGNGDNDAAKGQSHPD